MFFGDDHPWNSAIQLPGLDQVAVRAEIAAVLVVLMWVKRSIILYIDCQIVVDLISIVVSNPHVDLSSYEHADLWKAIRILLINQCSGTTAVKVKAHTELTEDMSEQEQWYHHINKAADNLAVQASLDHCLPREVKNAFLHQAKFTWARQVMMAEVLTKRWDLVKELGKLENPAISTEVVELQSFNVDELPAQAAVNVDFLDPPTGHCTTLKVGGYSQNELYDKMQKWRYGPTAWAACCHYFHNLQITEGNCASVVELLLDFIFTTGFIINDNDKEEIPTVTHAMAVFIYAIRRFTELTGLPNLLHDSHSTKINRKKYGFSYTTLRMTKSPVWKHRQQIADIFIRAAADGSNYLNRKVPWQLPAIPEAITSAYQQALSLTNRYRIASGLPYRQQAEALDVRRDAALIVHNNTAALTSKHIIVLHCPSELASDESSFTMQWKKNATAQCVNCQRTSPIHMWTRFKGQTFPHWKTE